MAGAQFGMIGLGTMGRNFLLNVAEQGVSCAGYDLDAGKRQLLLSEGVGMSIETGDDTPVFLSKLAKPRNIMMLVPAGPIVDTVIHDLLGHLEPEDLLIDGGNSHFIDTERRQEMLAEKKISFLGVGISGGEEGARHGASLMAGGDPAAYKRIRPIFEAASAKVDGDPCAAYVGRGSAGHFVKMVHNGIEYGLMQQIAETYDLLRRGFELDNSQIADIFSDWDRGPLNSFLIEITSTVLRKIDLETGKPLVDLILDTAGQKGTGKWTSEVALEFGIPVPTIDAAVSVRQISALKEQRTEIANKLKIAEPLTVDTSLRDTSVEQIRDGLHLAFIVTFAQGFMLLRAASTEKNYGLDLGEIAKIWRGGCIIRSTLLENIRLAYSADSHLDSLLLAPNLTDTIRREHALLKLAVYFAASCNVASMALAATLNYLQSFATERLPANLIQAQRDLFGAHTYQRIDKIGTFHTPNWSEESTMPSKK
jgi:6-phosphogluconate dehydrogenase